jgi:hypothetical protein
VLKWSCWFFYFFFFYYDCFQVLKWSCWFFYYLFFVDYDCFQVFKWSCWFWYCYYIRDFVFVCLVVLILMERLTNCVHGFAIFTFLFVQIWCYFVIFVFVCVPYVDYNILQNFPVYFTQILALKLCCWLVSELVCIMYANIIGLCVHKFILLW